MNFIGVIIGVIVRLDHVTVHKKVLNEQIQCPFIGVWYTTEKHKKQISNERQYQRNEGNKYNLCSLFIDVETENSLLNSLVQGISHQQRSHEQAMRVLSLCVIDSHPISCVKWHHMVKGLATVKICFHILTICHWLGIVMWLKLIRHQNCWYNQLSDYSKHGWVRFGIRTKAFRKTAGFT